MKKATTTPASVPVKKATTTATSTSTTTVKKATTTATATKSTGQTATKTTAANKPAASTTKTSSSSTTGTKSTATSTKAKTDTKSPTKKVVANKASTEAKEVEVKDTEIKAQEPQELVQKEEQKEQKQEIVLGEVTITYNHYKNKFPITNGEITSLIIDDEYCMSAVFLGNFKMHLFDETKKKVEEKINSENITTFSALINGKSYALQIEEDDAAEAERESKAFVAEKKEDKLRGERQEGCSCLFGNPCVDPGVCSDWKNRYEVAKKNGWKGFS